MNVVPYNESMRDEWDELVSSSPNGTFLQSRSFLELQSSQMREDSLVALTSDLGEVRMQAVLPGVRVEEAFVSHLRATHGGVIFRDPIGLSKTVEIVSTFAQFLRQDSYKTWRVTPVPIFLRRLPWEADLYAFWRLNCRLVARGGSTFLPANSSLGRRKNRALARRAGVTCRETNEVGRAFGLIRATIADRHGVEATHTIEELSALVDANPKNIRLVEAAIGGELLAASVLFHMPSVVHFQYMGSSPAGREVQALDAVVEYVWESVRHPGEGLSFGVSTTDSGHTLNHGLASFKEGFGALPRAVDAYKIHL